MTGSGIRVFTGTGNTIGGAAPGAGNLVSGNNGDGISIETVGNLVQGNRVGTDVAGSAALPNSGDRYPSATSAETRPSAARRRGLGNLVCGQRLPRLRSRSRTLPSNIVVQGNRIGTDLHGAYRDPEPGSTASISSGASHALIGGTTAAARNLISGNLLDGIFFTKFSTVVPRRKSDPGQLHRDRRHGTVAIPNLGSGVSFEYALGTLGGRRVRRPGNVISGNLDHGIRFGGITDASTNPNRVLGNFIGPIAFGTGGARQRKGGRLLLQLRARLLGRAARPRASPTSSRSTPVAASPRRPARSVLLPSQFDPLQRRPGGRTGPKDGVTPNQAPGTFVYENFPILTSASTSAAGTDVGGTLSSGYALSFTIHVFAYPTCDASGYGEAPQYLGSTTVNTTAGTDTPFSATLPTPAPAGSYVTALAVAPTAGLYHGESSEFSFCRQVPGSPPPGSVPLELFAVAPSTGGNTGARHAPCAGRESSRAPTARLVRSGQAGHRRDGRRRRRERLVAHRHLPAGRRRRGTLGRHRHHPGTDFGDAPAGLHRRGGHRAGGLGGHPRTRHCSSSAPGGEQTFFLVFGNRGNVDAPPTEMLVTIPRQLRVTFVEKFDGSRPVVSLDVPRTTGGTGESTIHLFVPSVPANSSRALAFRLLTIEADPGEFGQEVDVEVWAMTSEGLADVIPPVDPNATVSTTVVDDTPTHLEWILHVSDGTTSGDVHYDHHVQRRDVRGGPRLHEDHLADRDPVRLLRGVRPGRERRAHAPAGIPSATSASSSERVQPADRECSRRSCRRSRSFSRATAAERREAVAEHFRRPAPAAGGRRAENADGRLISLIGRSRRAPPVLHPLKTPSPKCRAW